MPVRSLNSSVLIWPDRKKVTESLHDWAIEVKKDNPNIWRVGYFGSYARDDWGVGSDLDIVLVLNECNLSFEYRAAQWDLSGLPVPVDVLVYTIAEWNEIIQQVGFGRRLAKEVIWIQE